MLSSLVSESHTLIATPEPNLAAVQLPDRSVRPEVIREVLRACRNQNTLKMIYASMQNPQWHERIISHTPWCIPVFAGMSVPIAIRHAEVFSTSAF